MEARISLLFLISFAVLFQAGCRRGAQDYLERGDKFFEARKYEDASIQYRKAIQKDPNFGEAWFRTGLVEMERKKGGEAYAPLFRAVQLMPQNDVAKTRLADVILALLVVDPRHPGTLYDQVEKLADQLLEKNRRSFDGLRLKGSLRLLDRNPQKAIAFFEEANRIEPMRPDLAVGWAQALFQHDRVADGERLALEIIAKNKTFGSMYDVLYRQYMSTNRITDAENILKTKAANNPGDASYVLQLARHYASARNSAEMNNTLRRILNDPKDFPEARLQAGDFYAGLGQWDQAVQQFEAGSRSTQKKEKLVYQKRMADTLLVQGKKDEARRIVELILKDEPKDEDARRIRATLLLDTGGQENIATVLAELNALGGSKADDARLRFLIGRAYLAQGDLDSARNEFQQVVGLRKDDLPSRFALASISLNRRKPDEALRYADEILAQDAANGPAKLLRVNAMTAAGYYGRARVELMELLHKYPDSPDLELQLGLLDVAEKKYSEAERIFRKLNRPGTGDSRPIAGLVEVYSAQNQWDRAIEMLGEDLRKSPDSIPIRTLLATTAARARKYDIAVTQYQSLLAKDPKSVEVRVQLGEIYRLKGDRHNAIAVLEQARQLAPKDPEPVMLLASMFADAGRNSEAEGYYRRVLELRPDNPFVLNSIAFVLAEKGGNMDEALRLAQRALEKVPGHPVITDTLGWIYLKKGMKDSAVQTFSNLVRKEPQNPTYRYHFAMALLENGDKQGAKSEVKNALASQPVPEMEEKIKALANKIG